MVVKSAKFENSENSIQGSHKQVAETCHINGKDSMVAGNGCRYENDKGTSAPMRNTYAGGYSGRSAQSGLWKNRTV